MWYVSIFLYSFFMLNSGAQERTNQANCSHDITTIVKYCYKEKTGYYKQDKKRKSHSCPDDTSVYKKIQNFLYTFTCLPSPIDAIKTNSEDLPFLLRSNTFDPNQPYKKNTYYWHYIIKHNLVEVFKQIMPYLHPENIKIIAQESIRLNKYDMLTACLKSNSDVVNQITERIPDFTQLDFRRFLLPSYCPVYKFEYLSYIDIIVRDNRERMLLILCPYLTNEHKKLVIKEALLFNKPGLIKICFEQGCIKDSLQEFYNMQDDPKENIAKWNNLVQEKSAVKHISCNRKMMWQKTILTTKDNTVILLNKEKPFNQALENRLMNSLLKNDTHIIKDCLEEINPNGKDAYGESYWHKALRTHNQDIFDLFCKKISPENVIKAAQTSIIINDGNMLEVCIRNKADVNEICKYWKLSYAKKDNRNKWDILQIIARDHKRGVARVIIPYLTHKNVERLFYHCFNYNSPYVALCILDHYAISSFKQTVEKLCLLYGIKYNYNVISSIDTIIQRISKQLCLYGTNIYSEYWQTLRENILSDWRN